MAIAIFDVGKTNVKLSLVEAGAIRETLSAPNRVLPGPPFPHYDETGIWSFLMRGLARLGTVAPITDIVAVAHGGGCGLVDAAGALVLPMLDYEMPIEDDDYDRAASPFSETFSPPLGGLNIARQLHWFQKAFPAEFRRARHLLLYPQYSELSPERRCQQRAHLSRLPYRPLAAGGRTRQRAGGAHGVAKAVPAVAKGR